MVCIPSASPSINFKTLTKKNEDVEVKLGEVIINAPDYHIISILLKEKFIDEEYLIELGSSRPIIIDCGANIGVSLIYFKYLYPHSEVHCFEPYTFAFEYLQKNVAENKLKRQLFRRAICI